MAIIFHNGTVTNGHIRLLVLYGTKALYRIVIQLDLLITGCIDQALHAFYKGHRLPPAVHLPVS